MTECERLIAEGLFDKSFFETEVRNGFLVDTTRKKVWAVEIDLLLQLDRVCKKYGLQYYLMFGSLLGAIRHDGYIPWDDDLDVSMPRRDYEILLKVAPQEFKEPYFFQIPETDPGYYYTFAKIRNSNTSAFSNLFQYQRFNMGLLLDILPVDVCDPLDVQENFINIQKLTLENSTYMRMSNHHLSELDRQRVRNYQGGVPYETYQQIQRIAMKYEDKRELYDKRIVAVFTGYKCEKMVFDAVDLSEIEYHAFEGFSFPIPKGYDRVLRVTYGDYMQFPPIEERGMRHIEFGIDPDKSYKEYYSF